MSHALQLQCERRLSWQRRRPACEELQRVADYCRGLGAEADAYGQGEFLNAFEREVAECLGQQQAWFLPSGAQAQQIALRTWAEERRCFRLALSPYSHLELEERLAYRYLSGLTPCYLGTEPRPPVRGDLEQLQDRVGVLTLELPLRALGGVLPSWSELQAIKAWARDTNTPVHLDGARLWETACHYQQPLAAICEGFDSVYVSFYKVLGSTSGALLASSEAFLRSAAPWKIRYGGRLAELHPLVLPAKLHFEQERVKLPRFALRAAQLAQALADVPGLELVPKTPHINMFHVYFRLPLTALEAARDRVAREDRVWLCSFFAPPAFVGAPGECYTEVVVADAADDFSVAEVAQLFDKLVTLARAA